MLEGGAPLSVVASILGWSPATTVRMAKRYGHIGQVAQRQAVEILDRSPARSKGPSKGGHKKGHSGLPRQQQTSISHLERIGSSGWIRPHSDSPKDWTM